MSASERSILHVDMDAFYASIEQRDRPELAGLPVIVGGLGRRGVVSTCSYEARPFGVHSAMPTAQARRLCPHAVFVRPRADRYEAVSEQIFEVFAEVTPLVEGLSLDEAFLDIGASLRLLGSAESIARIIKQRIRERTGLSASVGIGPNKLVAKLASELSKPDGLLRIHADQVRQTLAALPVSRLWTVGKVSVRALEGLGIHTIGELAACDPARLERALGRGVAGLQALARGEDSRPVEPTVREQSIGAEHTFEDDVIAFEVASGWLLRECERVAARARSRGLAGRTVTVKLREPPFVTYTRQAALPAPTASAATMHEVARRLLATWWRERSKPRLRLLGVSLSGFRGEAPQADLFAAPVAAAAAVTDALQDRINARFGDGSLTRAGTLRTRAARGDDAHPQLPAADADGRRRWKGPKP